MTAVVECIDPTGFEGFLEYGWKYKVTRAGAGAVWVEANGFRFLVAADRFDWGGV